MFYFVVENKKIKKLYLYISLTDRPTDQVIIIILVHMEIIIKILTYVFGRSQENQMLYIL